MPTRAADLSVDDHGLPGLADLEVVLIEVPALSPPAQRLRDTILHELERSDKETALITLCVGAGMGTATVIERV